MHVYDNEGIYSHKVPIYCLDSGTEGTVAIAGIDWFAGPSGPENQTPSLCLGFENGRMQIMRSDADDKPVLLDTQLRCTGLKWDPNGSVVAIAGIQAQNAVNEREVGIVQFYAPSGQHLRSLLLGLRIHLFAGRLEAGAGAEPPRHLLGGHWPSFGPGGGLSHLLREHQASRWGCERRSWLRSELSRPDYLWGYFSHTLVYAVGAVRCGSEAHV